jgi:DNA-binding transcriptional ArsR family regulator
MIIELCYRGRMREPHHPDCEQVDLAAFLHALSDPARLEIVRMLAPDLERPCGDFHGVGGVSTPTLSHHLRVLREAGVTRTRIEGKRRHISLRRDTDAPFPGVLEMIMDTLSRRTDRKRARPAAGVTSHLAS